MKKFLSLISILFLMVSANAQENATITKDGAVEYVPIYINSLFFTNIPKQKTPPKGSVYLNDDFQKGMIMISDSTYIDNVYLNYNFYTKRLELKTYDSTLILSPLQIKWFKLKGSKGGLYKGFQYYFDYPEFKDCGLAKVYFDNGGVQLVEKYYLKLIKSNYNTALDAGSTSDIYVVASKKYIIKDGKAYRYSLNKHSLLSILSDKKTEIKKFAKENNLKFNKLSDVLIILKYYTSLR